MAKESNFIKANVREFQTNSGKTGFNIDLNVEDLGRLPKNNHGYVKMTMRARQEKGKYGDTHFLVENDYIPEKTREIEDTPVNNTSEEYPF